MPMIALKMTMLHNDSWIGIKHVPIPVPKKDKRRIFFPPYLAARYPANI